METILLFSSILLWILGLFNIMLTLGLARRITHQFPKLEFLKTGQPAPDFTAWTFGGELVTQSDYTGRAASFIFVSPHCQPCREEIPKLESWHSQSGHNGVELVLVSDANEEETQRFIEEVGAHSLVLIAPRERTDFLKDYKVAVTPSYCLINAERKVQAAGLDLEELREQMKNLSR